MKKLVVLCYLLIWAGKCLAQIDYEPFLLEGKTWLYHEYDVNFGGERTSDINEITYTVLGDTLVEKLDCKIIRYYNKKKLESSKGVAYERDKKVYSVNQTGDTTLIFDFGMNVGDTLLQMTMDEYSEITEVTGLIDFHNNGNQYQGIVLETFYETNGRLTEVSPYDTIILGIGYSEGIDPINYMGSCVRRFVSCTWPDGRQYITEYGKKYLEEQNNKDYEPFLVEGKTWWYHSEHIFDDTLKFDEVYTLRGDTLIDGKIWKKVYVSYSDDAPDSFSSGYYAALLEEDRKVYFIQRRYSESFLEFDFGLQIGQSPDVQIEHENDCRIILTKVDTMSVNEGFNLRVLTFEEEKPREYDPFYLKWIEGVGNLHFPLQGGVRKTGAYYTELVSCTWPDGRQYVTEYGKKYLEGIRSIKNEQLKMNNEMYDLQGFRAMHPKKGGIYIQNGRKIRK